MTKGETPEWHHSRRNAPGLSSWTLIASAAILASGCGSQHGATKPNWFLADFDKYAGSYYLDLSQIRPGDALERVVEQFGTGYATVDEVVHEGHVTKTLRFPSYRATAGRDPIDKYVYVTFENGVVVSTREELVRRTLIEPQRVTQSADRDVISQLERLKKLLDDGAITEAEYAEKKRVLLERL